MFRSIPRLAHYHQPRDRMRLTWQLEQIRNARAQSRPMPTTLLHVFPTFAIGGQQTRFATIANRLGPAIRHRLISLDGRAEAAALLDRTLDFDLLSFPSHNVSILRRLRTIAKVSAEVHADILVTYNWGAMEWAFVNRWSRARPHIHLEDGFGLDEADRQKPHRVLARRLTLQRSTLLVPSRNLAEIACTHWKLRPQNVTYIPNGIDPGRFDRLPTDGNPHFQCVPATCTIGSFSPLRPEKNIRRLLEAFAELAKSHSAIRLVICGDGPERNYLQEFAKGLGIAEAVDFVGHVKSPETVMGQFDLFAMTSDTEQMPYAVLEAMAASRAIVATAVGDIPTMVAEENRPFIVRRDDRQQLVNALAQLSQDASLRRRLGRANRRRVERSFPIEQMADAFQRTIVSLISSRRAMQA
jgi:glycosyltransferase involved in cell wall biosynthesis